MDVLETTYSGGQVETFRLAESTLLFYEIKHSKPVPEYGSKVKLYSKNSGEFSVKAISRLIGAPKIKSRIQLPDDLAKLLTELAVEIGSFEWKTELCQSEWPKELRGHKVLKFECKDIEHSVALLDSIREMHLVISQII